MHMVWSRIMITVIHALILLWCVHQMRMLLRGIMITVIHALIFNFLYVRRINNNLLQPERFTHPANLPQRVSITTKKTHQIRHFVGRQQLLLDSSSLSYRSKASCWSRTKLFVMLGLFKTHNRCKTAILHLHLFKKQNIKKRRNKHRLKVLQLIVNDKSGRSLQKLICRRLHNTKLHNHNVWLTQFVSTRLACSDSHAHQCLLRPPTTPWLFFLANLL